jgi:hypothetical protein
MKDIPLILLVALTLMVGHLLLKNLELRERVSATRAECEQKQGEIERLLELNDGLMRLQLGLKERKS